MPIGTIVECPTCKREFSLSGESLIYSSQPTIILSSKGFTPPDANPQATTDLSGILNSVAEHARELWTRKDIQLLTIILALAVLGFAIKACSSSSPRAIERVLVLDHQASASGDRYQNPSEGLRAVVSAMEAIDLRKCPPDFQQAYLRHTQAWSDAISVADKYQGIWGGVTAFLEGLGGQNVPEQQFTRVQDRIKDTWTDVKAVALRHGVNPGKIDN